MRIGTFAAAAVVAGIFAFNPTLFDRGTVNVNQVSITHDIDRIGQFGHSQRDWDTVCLPTVANAAASDRCHLRFVDFIDPRKPEAGFVAASVATGASGVFVQFDIKIESAQKVEISLRRDGHAVWDLANSDCLKVGRCSFSGPAAEALVAAFSDDGGHTLNMWINVVGPNEQALNHTWLMQTFAAALSRLAMINQTAKTSL